jgi:hypothetical protein
MARLVTKHDPYHIHKCLGVFVLLHYVYRIFLVCTTGDAFPPSHSRTTQSAGVLMHGLLSWSSLLLPLPVRRNFASPMIWPEFRLHSILFATRHVVCTLLTLHHAWPSNLYLNMMLKMSIVSVVMKVASYITEQHGCRINRTTNSMPYPSIVTPSQQSQIKMYYARAQFGATAQAVCQDATICFMPLIAIQMAPLLMTLVRKGKVTTNTYHFGYAVALMLGGMFNPVRLFCMSTRPATALMFLLMGNPSCLRLHYKYPRFVGWYIYFALTGLVWPSWVEPLIPTHTFPYAAVGFAIYGGRVLYVLSKNTLPYFMRSAS